MWSDTHPGCRGEDLSWEKPQSPEFTPSTARRAGEKPPDPAPRGAAGVSEKSSFTPCSAQLFPQPLPSPGMFSPILFHKRLKLISNRRVLYSGNSVIFPGDWLTQKLWLVAPKIASVTLHLAIRAEWMLNCTKRHHKKEITLVLSLSLRICNLPVQQELELRLLFFQNMT